MKMKDGKVINLDMIEHFINSDDHRGDPNAPVVFINYFIFRKLQDLEVLLKEVVDVLTKSSAEAPEAKGAKASQTGNRR